MSAILPLCLAGTEAAGSDRVESAASVTIVASAAVTVINTAPMQTLLLTAAIAPAGVVFTAPAAAPTGVGAAGGGAGGAAGPGEAALPAADGGTAPALVALGGSLIGTTIDGDAVSVSVGDVSGGSAPGSARISVVIAQYN